MNRLSDDLLITSYQKAITINGVDPVFISLLQEEIAKRNAYNRSSCFGRVDKSKALPCKRTKNNKGR